MKLHFLPRLTRSSYIRLLLLAAFFSCNVFATPEKPHQGASMYPIRALQSKEYLSNVQNRKKAIKAIDKEKKDFFVSMKRWHWLGSHILTTPPEFLLIWQPSFEDPDNVKEGLKFLHQLQPRLRTELGITLFLSSPHKRHEQKLLAALADAGVDLPIANHEYGDSHNWVRLAHITDAHGVYIYMPFKDLSAPEAEDIYFNYLEDKVGKIVAEMEDKLGKPFISRFYPTYVKTHINTK